MQYFPVALPTVSHDQKVGQSVKSMHVLVQYPKSAPLATRQESYWQSEFCVH
jgi:hypothetical protein